MEHRQGGLMTLDRPLQLAIGLSIAFSCALQEAIAEASIVQTGKR
jgi:hypothetical protein